MIAPSFWHEARRHLQSDALLAPVVVRVGEAHLVSRGDAFTTLVRAVVGQQISVKAAASVWDKITRHVGEITPHRMLNCTPDALRGCGLSQQKVRYILGVAKGFADGTVHPSQWNAMTDDAVIAELTQLPGIGRWTAEMFLMFNLMRPDVLPVGDLGLVNGFKKLYGHQWKTDGSMKVWQKRLTKHAARWAPYRTVATWYIWRSLDAMSPDG